MKILVVGGDTGYASWIDREIEFLESKLENVQQADLVFFTGGHDVDPSIYGTSKNKKTNSNLERDKLEREFYNEARKYDMPMFGTCRGCQLITALQPHGYLFQHVNGHAVFSPHEVEFNNGKKMLATSTHHQMMYPWNVPGFELIAWSATNLSDIYEMSTERDAIRQLPDNKEPEIVYYNKSRCLAVQPHPENMRKDSPLVRELNELLKEKFNL